MELVSGAGALAIRDSVEDKLRVLSQLPEIPAEMLAPAELAARLPILADFQGKAMVDADGGAIRTRAAFSALTGKLKGRERGFRGSRCLCGSLSRQPPVRSWPERNK